MRDARKKTDPLVPAYSVEAETSVLGALLMDNELMHRVRGLEPEDFHDEFYREVYRCILSLAAAGRPFDTVTVFSELQSTGQAAHGDEMQSLLEIHQYVPSASNLYRYVEIVKEKSQQRKLMTAAIEIHALASTPGKPAEHIDAAQMLLAKLGTVKSSREPQHINQSLTDYLDLLQALSEGRNPAIATGIGGLDKILNGGLRRGEVMVIGARPKHGKTALALTLARNMARGFKVLFLSQEMPISQLMHRHTAASGPFDLARILAANPSDGDMWRAVTEAARKLGELNLLHDDQCALSLLDIRRKALKVRREHGLDVLFIDFLQLMAGAGEESRNRELDVIVNGIKALAMDLQIGVVLLSQMARKADEHYGRPAMTFLRDSGAIEAAADQVALLFTDWAHPLSKRTEAFQGYSELEIVAHRNGPQGLVPLEFIGMHQHMGDWLRGAPPSHKQPVPPSRTPNF